ncbi:MAG: hypothetical protein EHM42_05890 [Planctomycetaceae bacterium]|nr:MAG: hypothetical protein EHM42_05890 [Planctomycetaceae bacterium]
MLWIATAVGAALGIVVANISRAVSRRLTGEDFWSALPELTRALASQSESDAFLKTYGRLIRLLASYLFRNAVQLGASFAPVIATVLLLGPAVMAHYNRGAVELCVHPPRELRISAAGAQYATDSSGTSITPVPEFAGTGLATTELGQFEVANLRRNLAWCVSDWGRLGMGLLGFETQSATEATRYLVLRPRRGDFTPLWPYLNDLEFFFYLAIAAASGATALFLKSRRS